MTQINNLKELEIFLRNNTNNNICNFLLTQPIFNEKVSIQKEIEKMYIEWYYNKTRIKPIIQECNLKRVVLFLQNNTKTEEDAKKAFLMILQNYPNEYPPQLYEFSFKIEYVANNLKLKKNGYTSSEIRQFLDENNVV